MSPSSTDKLKDIERPAMDVDIACVGFGPATAGFLATLSKALGEHFFESSSMPGLPLQVVCYERADDLSFGVSGVVTKGRSLYQTYPNFNVSEIPTGVAVSEERLIYLLDPLGVSRRSFVFKIADAFLRALSVILPQTLFNKHAFKFPLVPWFMKKHGKKHKGFVLSLGQLMQWVGQDLMTKGVVQLWPGTPVASILVESKSGAQKREKKVIGIRLTDQGVAKNGDPTEQFTPGMDIRARLVVIGDGPVGSVGQELDEIFGVPKDYARDEWAVGVKAIVELKEPVYLKPGTVLHTFGFPEPEIFGFMYVYPDHKACVGIFVPSWFQNPIATGYRYLQHWMMHPYLWQYLEGGTLTSFGAKSLHESGKRAEPYLVGEGFARIGEGSGTTNILSGSGVDEAWMTGLLLGEATIELLKNGQAFTKENLERTYVGMRRKSWVEKEANIAKKSRDGFRLGVAAGFLGMAVAAVSQGFLSFSYGKSKPKTEPTLKKYVRGRISGNELEKIVTTCQQGKKPLHDEIMDHLGWPKIPFDGKLLLSHQDALLLGGKVQAPLSGYRDHVVFKDKSICKECSVRKCYEVCSGQAIMPDEEGLPQFEREKCVHCGACFWSCTHGTSDRETNIRFSAGPGGLHSAIN